MKPPLRSSIFPPKASYSVLAALAFVAAAFATMSLGAMLWPDPVPMTDEPPAAAREPVPAPARRRCETCGLIEAIARTEAAAGNPDFYQFSVRLPDGSLRYSTDPLPGRWQVGDRMQLLGGGRTWSALEAP